MSWRSKRNGLVVWLFLAVAAVAQRAVAEGTVREVMDAVVGRLYANLSEDQLYALDEAQVQKFVSPEERKVLATKHWCFEVNAPVVVSVLRNVDQKVVPFWLAESGFKKTDLVVRNAEDWTYEVWQKAFPAGRVALGINGFEEFRPHYLVCVGPQERGTPVGLSGFDPPGQHPVEMKEGAFTYYDWTELVLTHVPEALRGQQLLPTTRGRAQEACLVGAFRKTPFRSSEKPAPVFLTWSEDPRTTQNVQWRTSASVTDGTVRYWEKGTTSTCAEAPVECRAMEDRMLANDRYCHWFTAVLRGLKPHVTYEYQAGSKTRDVWSAPAEFTTAPDGDAPFSFFYCSDTHNHQDWGELLRATFERHPEAAFCTIAGDLVATGQERDKWDEFLTYGEPFFRQRPVMPAIGNHDAQLGLPPRMYLDILGLPRNGPAGLEPERAYTFSYSNATFFVLDVMSDSAPQGQWLHEQLNRCTATWRFAVFHFPLYLHEEEYPELQEQWGRLFEEKHVDLVLTGHVHQYERTYPIRNGKRAASPAEGTIYITSVSIPGDPIRGPRPDLIEKQLGGTALCGLIKVEGTRCTFQALTAEGAIKDEFVLQK